MKLRVPKQVKQKIPKRYLVVGDGETRYAHVYREDELGMVRGNHTNKYSIFEVGPEVTLNHTVEVLPK